MMASHRPNYLQDYLVRAKLRPVGESSVGSRRTVKCNNKGCNACNYVIPGDSFSSHVTSSSYSCL